LGIAKPTADRVVWRVQTEAETNAETDTSKGLGVAVVLGPPTGRGFGYVFRKTESVVVGLSSPGDRRNVIDGFGTFWNAAKQNDLLPPGLKRPDDGVICHHTPAGGALDIETHVGKHTVVIGDAGGFLSAVSNETVYPSMWSAEIAADVVHKALDRPNVQDGLARFENRWRTTMADYLRMPNTDVQFLWPLVFVNQQMADKMAAEFLTGENI
jgi:flavin-dependent dehydrogenase